MSDPDVARPVVAEPLGADGIMSIFDVVGFLTFLFFTDGEGQFTGDMEELYRQLGEIAADSVRYAAEDLDLDAAGDEDDDYEDADDDEEGDDEEDAEDGAELETGDDAEAILEGDTSDLPNTSDFEAAVLWARSQSQADVAVDEYVDDDDVGYRPVTVSDADIQAFVADMVGHYKGESGPIAAPEPDRSSDSDESERLDGPAASDSAAAPDSASESENELEKTTTSVGSASASAIGFVPGGRVEGPVLAAAVASAVRNKKDVAFDYFDLKVPTVHSLFTLSSLISLLSALDCVPARTHRIRGEQRVPRTCWRCGSRPLSGDGISRRGCVLQSCAML